MLHSTPYASQQRRGLPSQGLLLFPHAGRNVLVFDRCTRTAATSGLASVDQSQERRESHHTAGVTNKHLEGCALTFCSVCLVARLQLRNHSLTLSGWSCKLRGRIAVTGTMANKKLQPCAQYTQDLSWKCLPFLLTTPHSRHRACMQNHALFQI